KSVYFSMDNPRVRMYSLYDLGKSLVLEGNNTLLIDEVHYYKQWKEDTKALYDEFPHVSIIVSGSAPLAFEPERRYEIIDVEPLSLSEYAHIGKGIVVEKNETWLDIDKTVGFLARNQWAYAAYSEYLLGAAFPTYLAYKDRTLESIYNSILKSVREDAILLPNVDGELVGQMQRALVLVASSSLGEFSINSTSNALGMNKNKAYHMIGLLESMRIIRMVRPHGKGAKLVRGDPKMMFYHPVMRQAICKMIGMQPDKGAIREEMAVFALANRGWKISTIKGMKKTPDYAIEKNNKRIIIEIGGQSKTKAQLTGFEGKTLIIGDRQLITLGLY
ncbi:MAG: AAA family ATPase, partial [Candidatus Micrarchaeia archaeon]